MHRLWIERKRVLRLKSDNELVLDILSLLSALPSVVCDRSQECEKSHPVH